jgi:hypothetical protein
MRKIQLVLPFFLLFFFLLSTNAFGATIIVNASADSEVSNLSAHANYNFGILYYMMAGTNLNSGNPYAYRSYMRFNLSSVPVNSLINSAELYVYKMPTSFYGSTFVIDAYNTSPYNTTGTTTFWNEGTLGTGGNYLCGSRCKLDQNITWTNKPASDVYQSNATIYNSSTPSGWITFDVTGAIAESYATTNMTSILLKSDTESAGWIGFYTKEYGSYLPYLSIIYNMTDCISQCGICGCTPDATGCLTHDVNGTWCDDYNLTLPCTYDGLVNATPCYDILNEILNPYNTSKNTFTTFKTDDATCGIVPNQCPANTMCVQFWNNNNKEYEGKIQCYDGTTGEGIFYNETGDIFNGEEYIEGYSTCDNPFLWNNSFMCIIKNCQWCSYVDSSGLYQGYCALKDSECLGICQNATANDNSVDCLAHGCNWCNDACQTNSCGISPSGARFDIRHG